MLATAILNLVFSVILGKMYGMSGILLATAIARILTLFWYEPRILFSEKLGGGLRRYWQTQIKYLILTVISFAFCYLISLRLPHTMLSMVVKGFIFMLVTIGMFAAGSFQSEEFSQLSDYAKLFLTKMRKRLKVNN